MRELLSIVNLTKAFSQFPSIGEKTAERMAYALLEMDQEQIQFLMSSIIDVKQNIRHCPNCGALIDTPNCPYCNEERDHNTCIVVPYPKDIMIFEKMDNFHGIYHSLNGELSSIKGISINDLRINELEERIKKEHIKELILATNPTVEGETTALYIAKLFGNENINITRLAHGIPIGSNIEYSDKLTLLKAIENRTKIK